MKLYEQLGIRIGTAEAAALCARLRDWHDAMVAHERRIGAGAASICHDECPHVEARLLWGEALDVLGDLAHELAFLHSRAKGSRVRPQALAARAGARAS